MQYVNDDMDELFRKAAESYPLDTGNSDWDRVVTALKEPELKEGEENKKKRFFWLLLLIPLALLFYQNVSTGKNDSKGRGQQKQSQLISSHEKNGVEKLSDNIKPTFEVVAFKKINKNGLGSVPSPGLQHVRFRKNNFQLHTGSADQLYIPTIEAINNESWNLDETVKKMMTPGNVAPSGKYAGEGGSGHSFTSFIDRADLFPLPGRSSMEASRRNMFFSPDRPGQHLKRHKKFYAGMMGGLDGTTVRFQKIDNAGFDAGLLLGYEMNKKWSLEGGVFLDKKFYYSKGKYFNTSKISYLPPNSWITELNGYCRMIEVPLEVKLNVRQYRNSSWFSTAGLSSYVMKKEAYDYVYYYATPGTYATHHKVYKNSSTNLFSVITISAGYTHRLGNWCELRVEPYVKRPVAGVGFGKLPMLSTGIHIGLTKKLF